MFVPSIESNPEYERVELPVTPEVISPLASAVDKFDRAGTSLNDLLRELSTDESPEAQPTNQPLTELTDSFRTLTDIIRTLYTDDEEVLRALATLYDYDDEKRREVLHEISNPNVYPAPQEGHALYVLKEFYSEYGLSQAFVDKFMGVYEVKHATDISIFLNFARLRLSAGQPDMQNATHEAVEYVGRRDIEDSERTEDLDDIRDHLMAQFEVYRQEYLDKKGAEIDYDDGDQFADIVGALQEKVEEDEQDCGLSQGEVLSLSGNHYLIHGEDVVDVNPGECIRGEYSGLVVMPVYESVAGSDRLVIVDVSLSVMLRDSIIVDSKGASLDVIDGTQDSSAVYVPLQRDPIVHLTRYSYA